MTEGKFFHILNPSERYLGAVRRFFKKKQDPFCWVERESHPTHLETIVEWALAEKWTSLAVWGGDGTLNRVIQALALAQALDKTAVALIPVGTANDFARKLRLPDWRRAAQNLSREKTGLERFDVGLLQTPRSKRVFINNAGFGRRPIVSTKKKYHPFKDIMEFEDHRLHLEWTENGGEQFETVHAAMCLVCNAPYFSKGLHFGSDVDPKDGLLNAYFVPPRSPLGFIWTWFKGRMGKPLAEPGTFEVEASKISVDSDIDLFPQVDGEMLGELPVKSVQFSILNEALHLSLPREG